MVGYMVKECMTEAGIRQGAYPGEEYVERGRSVGRSLGTLLGIALHDPSCTTTTVEERAT